MNATSSTVAAATDRVERSGIRWPIVWAVLATSLLAWGMFARLDLYITPQRGIGYWLGIVGGSMMILLLGYSARKRARWLSWMGGIPSWFKVHMALGIGGPILVLFHSGFRLGATNSNVALICMLLVAGSGIVGRYIYTRVHTRLGGNEGTLDDLRGVADRLRALTTSTPFLPGLLDLLDEEERRLMHPAKGVIGRFLHLFTAAARAALARWRIHRKVDQAVYRAVHHESESISQQGKRMSLVTKNYVDRRPDASRRVAEYKLYTKLFSLWHVLHLPLFYMLLIAGTVHVIAVNVY
jgi:hypothetical protein